MFKFLDDKLPAFTVAFALLTMLAQINLMMDDTDADLVASIDLCMVGECWQ